MDRCHLIPKQRIKRALSGNEQRLVTLAVWHPACWVWGCRRHHGNFDNRMLRVERDALPPVVEAYAELLTLKWSLERDYGSLRGAGLTPPAA